MKNLDEEWLAVIDQLKADRHKICVQPTYKNGKKSGTESVECSFMLGEIMIYLSEDGVKFGV